MSKPDTTHLDILTPALLLEIANEARDLFEWLDSYPTAPGEQFDGTAEEQAELLEELVRVRVPSLATELLSYMEGDDTRPQWQIRRDKGHTPNEYDADEPVAHIVQAIDQIANIPNTPVVDNMTSVAQSALMRARDSATTEAQRDSLKAALDCIENVPTSYDLQ